MIGKLKLQLIGIMLESDSIKQTAKFEQLIFEISRNIVPIIPNRSFNRTKMMKATKYSNQKRRAY